MKKFINKILMSLITFLVIVVGMSSFSYAADIRMQLRYGVNNQAKSGMYLPIEVMLQNRDNVDFDGYIVVNVYESNNSIYKYKQEINISKKSNIVKNMNISVSPRNNTIIVELYNDNEEKLSDERINIDLETLKNRLLIGILSNTPEKLMYLDELQIDNGLIKTKVVVINNTDFEKNRNILSQIDCLFISDIKSTEISDGLNLAIENFIKDGKVVFLGTGYNGSMSFPKAFQKYLYGPTVVEDMKYDFNLYVDDKENENNILLLPSTKYEFIGNNPIYTRNNNNYISNLLIGSGIVCNCTFSFNDIDNYVKNNNKFIIKLIENTLGEMRLSRIGYNTGSMLVDDYYNIKSIIDTVDNENLPNIFSYIIILSIYILLITIVAYVILHNMNKVVSYPFYICIIALLASVIVYCLLKDTRQKGTFLTYSSIVEINNEDDKETAFLNFRTLDEKDYSFSTSNNNIIYPMLQNTTEPIIYIENDIDKDKKETTFETENNVIYVGVKNSKNFEPSIFMYQSRNFDSKIYNIDVTMKIFNGEVDGRVTNKMDYDIKDASIITYGKVLYIGDIKARSSISLKRAHIYNAPIYNNSMLSELMCYYPRTKIAKYYLDNNIYQYYDDAKFVGFLAENNTINYSSINVEKSNGETMIVKNIQNVMSDGNMCDVSSLKYNVNNLIGQYNILSNTIDGSSEVVNEYTFDNNVDIKKLYFEQITDYDLGKIEFNVAFYGNTYIYNFKIGQYEQVLGDVIENNIDNYVSAENKILCRFVPTNTDVLYRQISLPQIRAIGNKR